MGFSFNFYVTFKSPIIIRPISPGRNYLGWLRQQSSCPRNKGTDTIGYVVLDRINKAHINGTIVVMSSTQSCEWRRQTNSTCSRQRFREIWKVSSLSRSLPQSGKKVSLRPRPRFGFPRPPHAENETSIAVRGSRLSPFYHKFVEIYELFPCKTAY
jgi:hypothetical protein